MQILDRIIRGHNFQAMTRPSQPILLVEDNQDDVFAIQRALERSRILNPLRLLTDGQQALEYLSGTGDYVQRDLYPLPFIMFLDLKLPYVDGFEVLAWVRQRPELQSLVSIVLTGSSESRDREEAYGLGARSYLVKPPTTRSVLEIFASLDSYWLSRSSIAPVLREPAQNGVYQEISR